jgi:hypothetical protein
MFFTLFRWSIQMELSLDIIEQIWRGKILIENGTQPKNKPLVLKSPMLKVFYSKLAKKGKLDSSLICTVIAKSNRKFT